MTKERRAKRLAAKKGFDSVKFVGEWSGLQVYQYYNTNQPGGGEIGLPSFILVNEKRARVTQGDEAFKIIQALFVNK